MMRWYRFGGEVNGSVSITKARNSKCVLSIIFQEFSNRTAGVFTSGKRVKIRAETKKENTRSNLDNFLVTSKPPATIKGIIGSVPTHQLAFWPNVNAINATPKAAGLKICFRLIARIYLVAMATADAVAAVFKNGTSDKETGGVKRRTSINAVMYADSTFLCARKIFAKVKLEAKQIAVIKIDEYKIINGLNGMIFMPPKTIAASIKTIR